jgi:hypothetical protein
MTALEIADEKRAQFEKSNPEIALWMKIKGVLSGDSGEQYFDGQMKDAELPQLKGLLVDAKPPRHSKDGAPARCATAFTGRD